MKTRSTLWAAIVGWFLLVSVSVAKTEYVEGEVIVTFKPTATQKAATAALSKKSLAFAKRFEFLSAKRNRQMGLVRDKTKTTAQLLAALKADPTVESVEPNFLRWVNADPNDSLFPQQWGFKNTGQTVNGTAGVASADIKFIGAVALARPLQNEIVVGVIDTGLDSVHPDLVANVWHNPLETPFNNIDDDGNGYIDDDHGYDFVDGDADPSESGEHGTHVAGTIAAVGNNQAGVIGVDDKVRILPLKVSPDGNSIDTASTISALQYVAVLKSHGVNVVAVNASYGGGGFSSAESAAIQAAGDAGIIMCAAAGNEASNNDSVPTYPANYRLPNMIVVAATNQSDALASFSNYGATKVDLAAPGTNIISTKPSTVSFQAGGTTYSSTALAFSGATTGLTGNIVDCGTGNTAAEFPSSVQGNIALIQRGTETFATKVTNAMNAGATAAIIYNNVGGTLNGTLGTAANWIPARAITRNDGLAIQAALPMTGAIVVTGNYQFLNGTSMATPHVAGAVGFAAMNFPADTVAQRRQRILSGVDIKASLQGKVATNGRLNLLRIVDANSDGVGDWQPVITTVSLPSGVIGDAYSQPLAATGGTQPYNWTIDSGSVPGISLSSTGVLSGNPTTTGTYPITARVTDQVGSFGTKAFTLTIAPFGPLHHFSWDFLPGAAYAGKPFAVKFTARDSGERAVTTASGTVNLAAAAGPTALSIAPTGVTLTDGSFIGYVSIAQSTPAATLTASQASASGTSGSLTIQSGTSSANDGVPDAWKSSYALSLASNAATTDSDGDGKTDLEEFLAGTNPGSPNSRFNVTSTATDGSTFFTLNFPAVAGKLYRVSRSPDLGTWTPVLSPILSTSDGVQSVSVPLTGGGAGFFRVETVPSP